MDVGLVKIEIFCYSVISYPSIDPIDSHNDSTHKSLQAEVQKIALKNSYP